MLLDWPKLIVALQRRRAFEEARRASPGKQRVSLQTHSLRGRPRVAHGRAALPLRSNGLLFAIDPAGFHPSFLLHAMPWPDLQRHAAAVRLPPPAACSVPPCTRGWRRWAPCSRTPPGPPGEEVAATPREDRGEGGGARAVQVSHFGCGNRLRGKGRANSGRTARPRARVRRRVTGSS